METRLGQKYCCFHLQESTTVLVCELKWNVGRVKFPTTECYGGTECQAFRMLHCCQLTVQTFQKDSLKPLAEVIIKKNTQ